MLAKFFPTWSMPFSILPQGTTFKYPHEFKQIIIQYYSALTVSRTVSQSKSLRCWSRKKSFFLNRAVQTLDLPKCRLFSYYHWLCCHMLTGFRRPQQDPCLGWYEFYISFLLCNLNSRDEATAPECERTERFHITVHFKGMLIQKRPEYMCVFSLLSTHLVHHSPSRLSQNKSHVFFFCLPPLHNINIFTREKEEKKINADQIETLQ